MLRVLFISAVRLSLLLAAALSTGCENDQEDKEFFYHGWTRPKSTSSDRDYFYSGKTNRSGAPEPPRLPSGEEL